MRELRKILRKKLKHLNLTENHELECLKHQLVFIKIISLMSILGATNITIEWKLKNIKIKPRFKHNSSLLNQNKKATKSTYYLNIKIGKLLKIQINLCH